MRSRCSLSTIIMLCACCGNAIVGVMAMHAAALCGMCEMLPRQNLARRYAKHTCSVLTSGSCTHALHMRRQNCKNALQFRSSLSVCMHDEVT